MYHFISGYTAKVAGTEAGVTEPQTTFSACFGAPFMPLHPTKYAEMLGVKMQEQNVNVWLINRMVWWPLWYWRTYFTKAYKIYDYSNFKRRTRKYFL